MSPRTIVIEPVLNGFVVQVGCQRVVFDTPARLGAEITAYYMNPVETERIYVKNKVNNTMDGPQAVVAGRDDRIIRREPIQPCPTPETCAEAQCEAPQGR